MKLASILYAKLFEALRTLKMIYCNLPLTRAELGSPATFRWLGGGAYIAPLSNFQTNRRSEESEAAIEISQQGDRNAILKFSRQYQISGQGQVKGQS